MSPDGPGSEAALAVIRNRAAIVKDASIWLVQEGYSESSANDIDRALRVVATCLSQRENDESFHSILDEDTTASSLLSYLVERICVPRDMGAPSAAAIHELARRYS